MGLSSFTSLIIMIIMTDSLPDWRRFENLIHLCILTLMYLGLLFCVMNIYTLQVGTKGINNKVLSCLCQKSVQSYHDYHFCPVLLCPLRTVYLASSPSSLPSSLDQASRFASASLYCYQLITRYMYLRWIPKSNLSAYVKLNNKICYSS